jgi:PAS domain-containing protein
MVAETSLPKAVTGDSFAGAGETGALLRALDWSTCPIRDPGTWPPRLQGVLDVLLHSKFPMFLLCGPERVLLYNDAYAFILGAKHPAAFGRPFFDVWPEVKAEITPIIDGAFRGEASFFEDLPVVIERGGYPELTYFTFSYSPVHDEGGAVAGALCICSETTEKVIAERRQAFRLDLENKLRLLSEPLEIIAAAEEALGRHLQVSRTGYGEVDETARFFTTPGNWTDGTVAHHAGTHDLAVFGADILGAMRRGQTLVVNDVTADPRSSAPESLAAFGFLETAAAITVSLIKKGRLTAALYVHSREPRQWTASEVKLVEDVAERTWSVLERARAEADRNTVEARMARVLESITEGFVLLDRDFRVLQINAAGLALGSGPPRKSSVRPIGRYGRGPRTANSGSSTSAPWPIGSRSASITVIPTSTVARSGSRCGPIPPATSWPSSTAT